MDKRLWAWVWISIILIGLITGAIDVRVNFNISRDETQIEGAR